MSDIDIIKKALDNWGRWARSDNPRLSYPSIAGGFGQMIHDDADAYHTEPVQAVPDPIDYAEAKLIDVAIMGIATRHVIVIKRYYYNLRQVQEDDLGAAQRALADKLEPKWAGYAVTLKRVA